LVHEEISVFSALVDQGLEEVASQSIIGATEKRRESGWAMVGAAEWGMGI
jgi:hypothetical protein